MGLDGGTPHSLFLSVHTSDTLYHDVSSGTIHTRVSSDMAEAHTRVSSDGADAFTTVKHILDSPEDVRTKTPIQRLERSWFEQLRARPESEWTPVLQKNGIVIQRGSVAGSPHVLVKFRMECENVDAAAMFYNFIEPETRLRWDVMSRDVRTLTPLDRGRDVAYYRVPAPVSMVADRDFLMHRCIVLDDFSDGEAYLVLMRSAKHPLVPVRPPCVRADTILNAYHVEHRGSRVTVLGFSLVDPGGQLPPWVVNLAISKSIYDMLFHWRKSASPEGLSSSPGHMEMVRRWVDRLRNEGSELDLESNCSTPRRTKSASRVAGPTLQVCTEGEAEFAPSVVD